MNRTSPARFGKRFILPALIFTLLYTKGFSQDRPQYTLIPPKVYVGDRAILVMPLQDLSGGDVALSREMFPFSEEIEFHRIAAERRPGGGRLVIDFAAYVPGILEIPPFEIAGETIGGLKIEISSILDSGVSGPVLSGPAGTLAVPGTSLLVYGTLSAVILLPLLSLLILLKGRNLIESRLEVWRRKRLIAAMRKTEKRLRKALAKNAVAGEILKTLSDEFRGFLGFWTGENCRAMTASELSRITPYAEGYGVPDGRFLGVFFTRCDRLRFGGNRISGNEAMSLLDDLRRFLKAVDAAQRKKIRPEAAA